MNCPSCNSALEQSSRFCGVCGYRLEPARPAFPPNASSPSLARAPGAAAAPAGSRAPQRKPMAAAGPGGRPQKPAIAAKAKGDDIYLNQVLNNRFKIESKIGEGGFGAVYRGVQLATGRKVALKLLHPEMTKDENLVARFRREGMVLCNLRDAHTITTYDFDQTPDGTLYIAMELLEGRSLHQVYHDRPPIEWRRMFKILGEMCSSLAEAHAQGIVHRDLKPENVYLESRPGNPEFVKILDFGIAKVMRGDTIDPQAPQLTATGQTLGTLEYMSPEQLMGKQLDGRSDVYALGVVAYEMITSRLPFPDAKGPAGLITAQLKQTPVPPSQANPNVKIPPAADRVILKCLEKDKNNRYADVSELAIALQDVLSTASEHSMPVAAAPSSPGLQPPPARAVAAAPAPRHGEPERRRIEPSSPGAATPIQRGNRDPHAQAAPPPTAHVAHAPQAIPHSQGGAPGAGASGVLVNHAYSAGVGQGAMSIPSPAGAGAAYPANTIPSAGQGSNPAMVQYAAYPQATPQPQYPPVRSLKWLWIGAALVVLAGGASVLTALLMN